MKKFCEIGAGFLVLSLFFVSNVFATPTDISKAPLWAQDAIQKAEDSKIITGFGDGSFRPNEFLNRAEAVTILTRLKKVDLTTEKSLNKFSDVPQDAWFAPAVWAGTTRGWLLGFPDRTFRPEKNLNRAEWAVLVTRAFGLTYDSKTQTVQFTDVPASAWFYDAVSALSANGLIRRDYATDFGPSEIVTRAEAAWQVAKILDMPRLMGTSKTNEFSGSQRADSRRVAIKPRNFQASKQGYTTTRKELQINAEAPAETVNFNSSQTDWVDVGTLRVRNTMEDAVQMDSLELELDFEATDVGPEGNFQIQIKTLGTENVKSTNQNGVAFFTGLKLYIRSSDELVVRVAVKPEANESFFIGSGDGVVRAKSAAGTTVGSYRTQTSSRIGAAYRLAPVTFETRRMATIHFEP